MNEHRLTLRLQRLIKLEKESVLSDWNFQYTFWILLKENRHFRKCLYIALKKNVL